MGELLLSTIVVTVNDKAIGLQLKKARLESGLSQEEVATKLGLTWEMISRYENGRSSSMKHLHRLAEIFEKPLGYFITTKEDEYETFDVNDIVQKLKDAGIGYNKALRNVVKLVEKLSGKGIDQDALESEDYYEVSSYLTERFPNLFALKLKEIEISAEVSPKFTDNEIGLFAPNLEPNKEDLVIGYDGISYKLMLHDPDGLFASLATLVQTERRLRD